MNRPHARSQWFYRVIISIHLVSATSAFGADGCPRQLGIEGFRIADFLDEIYQLRQRLVPIEMRLDQESKCSTDAETHLAHLTLERHERQDGANATYAKTLAKLGRARKFEAIDTRELEREILRAKDKLDEYHRAERSSSATLEQARGALNDAEEQARPKILNKLKSFIKDEAGYRADLEDFVNFASVRRLRRRSTVSLLVGNHRVPPDAKTLNALVVTATALVHNNYTVLIDAHASVSAALIERVPEGVLAIGASPNPKIAPLKQVVIRDAFLRWDAFTRADEGPGESLKVIGTDDSPLAIGAMLTTRLNTQLVTEHAQVGTTRLVQWREALDRASRDLGNYDYAPIPVAEPRLIGERFTRRKRGPAFRALTLDDLTVSELERATARADILWRYRPLSHLARAVIFGSGQLDPASAPLLYEFGFDLSAWGLGVANGGAGGTMLVSSMGAFDGGGESLGIPIGGARRLSTESHIPTDVHTHTLETDGYKTRLPLLFDRRDLVIVAPGGSGTIRELVIALVMRAEPGAAAPFRLVFVDDAYYGELTQFLKASHLPPETIESVTLNTRNELHAYLEREGLITAASPRLPPRGPRRALPDIR